MLLKREIIYLQRTEAPQYCFEGEGVLGAGDYSWWAPRAIVSFFF